jgi:tight adherence protein B
MLAIILSITIFVLIGGIVSLVILNTQSQKRNRLMTVVKGANYAQESKKKKVNTTDQQRFDLANKLKDEEADGKEKKKATTAELIMQAGMETPVKKFWIISLIVAACITLGAVVIGVSKLKVIFIAIIAIFGLPKIFLKMKAKKRQKKFMEEFADALESMRRLLQAGMPVSEAIKMVAREFGGPLGDEMGRVFDQQKIGVPLPEAVLDMAHRMPLTEVQMFATAVAIQAQTGSSLSEVLENLAAVIRARFKLRRKVQALSSEAKASAMIIGALPIFVGLGLYFVNREYIELLFTDGKGLLSFAIGWMCLGILVMRQMINFKV